MRSTTTALTESKESTINFECPISNEIMENPVLTACGHTFEESHIRNWINKSSNKDSHGECIQTCPMCIKPIRESELRPNFLLKSVLPFIKSKTEELAHERKENSNLKAKLHTSQLMFQSIETKDEKKTTSSHQSSISLMSGSMVLNRLLQNQSEKLAERKRLITTTVPVIKAENKKRLIIQHRLQELDRTLGYIDPKLPTTDPLYELKAEDERQKLKYAKIHAEMVNNIHTKIIDPYIVKLTELNRTIEKNENDLKMLRKAQLHSLAKGMVRSKLMTVFSPKVFGGENKPIVPIATQPVESKEPIKIDVPKKSSVSVIESAKESLKLMTAILNRNHTAALIALQNGANPNATYPAVNTGLHTDPNAAGLTVLRYASQLKDLPMMRALLEYKADPNILSKNGESLLHWAGYYKNIDMLLLLLEFGADPRNKDTSGRDAITAIKSEKEVDPFIIEVLQERVDELNRTKLRSTP